MSQEIHRRADAPNKESSSRRYQQKQISRSRSGLSTDELPTERNKKIKDLKTDIERKLRQNKNLTVVIVE